MQRVEGVTEGDVPMGPGMPGEGPRKDFLGDFDYFMAVAILAAKRSRDPNTQVGACIVNQEMKIVGIGHNSMPKDSTALPWTRDPPESHWKDNKHLYVCHAELNAIMNKNSADVKGCTMYVTLFPCKECAKLISQAGIKDVIYLSDKYHERRDTIASKRLLDTVKIAYKKFGPPRNGIAIEFDDEEKKMADTSES